MSTAGEAGNFPTMIIPRGTEIRISNSGQLSIRTPGNLVIQNSGTYSELESTNGSIRIDDNVSVEAVTVRAAQGCFIQGTLTAWRVHAKKIALEDRAQAYIMLEECEQLEVSKSSRLVGNFANEKEIFLMLGKFNNQLKELPGSVDLHAPAHLADSQTFPAEPASAAATLPEPDLPLPLRQALSLMEHELRRVDLDPHSTASLRDVVSALREHRVQRAGVLYRGAFAENHDTSEALQQAYDLIEGYFSPRP
jgi:hypothetical protein